LDTLIHDGSGRITDVQVIGISNLDEAAETARSDRSADLAQAISLFDEIKREASNQEASSREASNRHNYLQSSDAINKLKKIVQLEPRHISAKLLLGAGLNTQRRRLSAGASEYYTFTAIAAALPTLVNPSDAKPGQATPEAIDLALRDLKKLRPMSDLRVQPMIDAWSEFISMCSEAEAGRATEDQLDAKRQALLNVMAHLNANKDMIEKMLNEGV
jgi:hypothetical protein